MNMEMELLLASALICIKRSKKKKILLEGGKKACCGRLCHLRKVLAFFRIIRDTSCRTLKHVAALARPGAIFFLFLFLGFFFLPFSFPKQKLSGHIDWRNVCESADK